MRILTALFAFLMTLSFQLSANYTPLEYRISNVDLTLELDDEQTLVTSKLNVKRLSEDTSAPLTLDGVNLKLCSISLNNQLLDASDYQLGKDTLTLYNLPNEFELAIVNLINPKDNASLEGLYKSGDIFCTQNESQGFRKITYFIDRPDNMATYTTKIIANKENYPVLLSNGNLIDQGDLANGQHYVVWQDPFYKPSYLFALVAGDLDCLEDQFMRKTGQPVSLKIFCEKGLLHKCEHGMASLKKAMKWDEDRFNLVCDLDTYMIVAINAFNSGAMENKGLNIFNSDCILVDPMTSTDQDFSDVESVIGHEYFHNWTGNRVTLRDWQELNVKESLTVFRDQEFSLDMNPRTSQRIKQVNILQQYQFPEDAGPTAHAIRPNEPIEVRNLYSSTVYVKGPEVVRMLQTLLGREKFNQGIANYFKLYDGMAVTTEQFLTAMEQASQRDLTQFKRWYTQKGTPHLKVSSQFDSSKKQLLLTVNQYNLIEGADSPPLLIPLNIGFLNSNGEEIGAHLIEVSEKEQRFVFDHISENPMLSLNRDFAAPVIVEYQYSDDELAFLMMHDTNAFNRWSASKEHSMNIMSALIEAYKHNQPLQLPNQYRQAFTQLLLDPNLDPAVKADALRLPTEKEVAQNQKTMSIDANHEVRSWIKQQLALENEQLLLTTYQKHNQAKNDLSASSVASRSLKNLSLGYLAALQKPQYFEMCYEQFNQAMNMTDQLAALSCLAASNAPQLQIALDQFYDQWQEDTLVVNKWLSINASQDHYTVLNTIIQLTQHPAFDAKEPNKQRSLLGSFLRNTVHYHAKDGSGYAFLADQISQIDKYNCHLAANLAVAFRDYDRLDSERKAKMGEVLANLLSDPNLSADTKENLYKIYNPQEKAN